MQHWRISNRFHQMIDNQAVQLVLFSIIFEMRSLYSNDKGNEFRSIRSSLWSLRGYAISPGWRKYQANVTKEDHPIEHFLQIRQMTLPQMIKDQLHVTIIGRKASSGFLHCTSFLDNWPVLIWSFLGMKSSARNSSEKLFSCWSICSPQNLYCCGAINCDAIFASHHASFHSSLTGFVVLYRLDSALRDEALIRIIMGLIVTSEA